MENLHEQTNGATAHQSIQAAFVSQKVVVQRRIRSLITCARGGEAQAVTSQVVHQLRHVVAARLPGAVEVVRRVGLLEQAEGLADLVQRAMGGDEVLDREVRGRRLDLLVQGVDRVFQGGERRELRVPRRNL